MKKLKKLILSVDWNNVSPQVYARYIMSIIVIVNTILSCFEVQIINISDEMVYQLVSITLAVITIVVATVNTYYNNSTSKEAIAADMVKDVLKGITDAATKKTAMDQLSMFLSSLKDSALENAQTEYPEDSNGEQE